MSKILSLYVASLDYSDQTLIVSPATNGSLSIASFTTVSGAHVGIAKPSFSFAFSRTTGMVN